MGIYRRKDKEGKAFGPFIVQYPQELDPLTGKLRYKTVSVGFSRKLANDVFRARMLEWQKKKHLGLETKKDYSFRELADWYLDLPSLKQLKTSGKITEHTKRLKAHFGNMIAREIRPYMVEEYMQKRLSATTKRGTRPRPASVNREFEVLKRIFNLAIREELVERNPCFKVSKLIEGNARDRILSYEEFVNLTEELPNHAAEIVRMGYFTGMRFGEIVGLTWDRVNLKEGCIILTAEDTKTSKPRRVFLAPQAVEVIERARKVRGIAHRYVFTYKGAPVGRINTSLRTALRKTEIRDFRFHDLRRTFNTNMQRAGVRNTVTMEMTGHKTLSMFVRYSSVDPGDAKEAMGRLSAFLEGESKDLYCNITADGKKGSGGKA